jgi:hypothetical protein
MELQLPWITVYEGIDTMFQDSGLVYNTEYEYRIISWNAVGHSDIIYFSCKTLSIPGSESTSVLSVLYFLFKSVYGIVQFMLSIEGNNLIFFLFNRPQKK